MGRQHTRKVVVEPFGSFWASVPATVKTRTRGVATRDGRGSIQLGAVKTVRDHLGTPVRVNVTGNAFAMATVERQRLEALATARRDAAMAKRSLQEKRRAAGIAGHKTRGRSQRAELIAVAKAVTKARAATTNPAYARMAERVRAKAAIEAMQAGIHARLAEIGRKYDAAA